MSILGFKFFDNIPSRIRLETELLAIPAWSSKAIRANGMCLKTEFFSLRHDKLLNCLWIS